MSLHPLMAQALRPFAPPERLEAQVANAARLYQAPPCPKGCFTYHEQIMLDDASIICHLEYEPAERGSREHGLQMEPDYPAQVTLVAAYVRDVNVYDLLSDDQIEQIEISAARDLEEQQAEAEGEARAERLEYQQEY